MRSDSLKSYSRLFGGHLMSIAFATVVAACGVSRPAVERDFASEWVEVQDRYPAVARAFLEQQSIANVLPKDRYGKVTVSEEWLPSLCELERERLVFIDPTHYSDYCRFNAHPPGASIACVKARVECMECDPTGGDPCESCSTWEEECRRGDVPP
jgi:hypothetical protein